MPKRAKKTNINCEEHIFSLKPKQHFCRYSQSVCISFCDQAKDKSKNKEKICRNTPCLECPIFNKDSNYATPTFILNSEKLYYEERGLKMKEQHEKKMVEYTDEKDSLNVPKPRTKNNFCSVCRQVYEDYLDHIQSDRHRKKINASNFNRYIMQLSEKFNPTSKNIFNLSHHTLSTRDQDDVEIIQNMPKKKIKTDYQNNQRLEYYPDYFRPQIALPPHIGMNHSGYFPRYGSDMHYMPNPAHHMTMPPSIHPHFISYNMNIFMNALNYPYHSYPYGLYNHMMEYYPNQRMNQMPFPRMEPNYFPSDNFLGMNHFSGMNEKNGIGFNSYNLKMQQKRQIHAQNKEIIVINDDEAYNRHGWKVQINL